MYTQWKEFGVDLSCIPYHQEKQLRVSHHWWWKYNIQLFTIIVIVKIELWAPADDRCLRLPICFPETTRKQLKHKWYNPFVLRIKQRELHRYARFTTTMYTGTYCKKSSKWISSFKNLKKDARWFLKDVKIQSPDRDTCRCNKSQQQRRKVRNFDHVACCIGLFIKAFFGGESWVCDWRRRPMFDCCA